MEHETESHLKSKLRRACIRVDRHFPAHLPRLIALTDPERTPDPVALALKLPASSGLIYRHFGSENRRTIATELAAIARENGITLLIGNDPALAAIVGASGVHWPEANMANARRWTGRFHLMTSAAHSLEAIKRAGRIGLDAALVSTVFPSRSASAGHPFGATRFRQLVRRAPIPVYGLGGITAKNAGIIADYAGISAIEGIDRALSPKT
ncbi:MAG: thiamine phosphate synthase [Pseudomonadota bacterium]